MTRINKRKNNFETPVLTGLPDDYPDNYTPSQDDISDDDSPIATEEHRIVTKFVVQRPVDELPISSDPPKPTPQPVVVGSRLPFEPQDEVEEFLREISVSTAGWELLVYRLPRYEINGKTDPQSRMRVGKLQFSWDYELEVQRRWARPGESNHFLIVAKKDGQHVKNGTLPVFSCEPLPVDERIPSGADLPSPVPTPQQVVVPYPMQPEPAPQPRSLKEQLGEAVELVKMVQSLSAGAQPPALPDVTVDPDFAVFKLLSRNEGVMERLSDGVLGKLMGGVEANPVDPWAEIAKDAIKSGQASELLKVAIDGLFRGVSNFIPNFAPTAPQSQIEQPAQQAPLSHQPQIAPQSPATPAEELLQFVLVECARNSPRQAVCDGLLAFSDQINEADPLHSVDWYITAFAQMTPEDALAFVNASVPGAEQITALPHALDWTRELQELLKPHFGSEADEHRTDTEDAG